VAETLLLLVVALDEPECFLAAFFVLFVVAVLLVVFVVVAGVVCATSETPASAIVMVRPIIAETVFFIV